MLTLPRNGVSILLLQAIGLDHLVFARLGCPPRLHSHLSHRRNRPLHRSTIINAPSVGADDLAGNEAGKRHDRPE